MRLANHEQTDPVHSLRRRAKLQDFFGLICCLGFVAIGVFLLMRDGSLIFVWLSTLLLGACSLAFFWKLVTDRDPASERKWKKITFDSMGFAVTPHEAVGGKSLSMLWSEVFSAVTFKRDEFIVDCICLFLAREDGTGVETDEEMEGWSEFTAALPTYLPGCRPWEEWFWKVVSPAFAPNLTEVFSRKSDVKVGQERQGGSSVEN